MVDLKFMDHLSGFPGAESVSGSESGDADVAETVCLYLKHSKKCVEAVQNMPSPEFNNEQCEYLARKFELVVDCAASSIEVWHAEHHTSHSSTGMARGVANFKYLLALAEQIECFIQGCCRDMWIEAAMTLTNVSEYVSSLGFNLELCRVAFCKESAATGSLTLDEVDDINNAEVETVQEIASADVATLLAKVVSAMNSLTGENRDLATYLLQRLLKLQLNPASFTAGSNLWFVSDDEGFWKKWFKLVIPAERLGKGSSAIVHKATWLGTPVAKKTFQGRENPEFLKEVDILARLCHPNITSMFCCEMGKRSCSIIMELMDEDLHDLMQRRLNADNDSCPWKFQSPFTILEAIAIMLQVGEGVNYLHKKDIVHKDLKSMNILVKNVKPTGLEQGSAFAHVKVADFGLSKTKSCSVRFSNQTLNTGTNRWMPPEIINLYNAESHGSTSLHEKKPNYPFKGDVYSFAMVCYEILTGSEPFPNEVSHQIVKEKVLKGERPDLPAYCPLELKRLIEKCWSHVPEERPSFPVICSELRYLKCLLMMGNLWERNGKECARIGNTDYSDHGGRLAKSNGFVLGKRLGDDVLMKPVTKCLKTASARPFVLDEYDFPFLLPTPESVPSSSSRPSSSSFAIPSLPMLAAQSAPVYTLSRTLPESMQGADLQNLRLQFRNKLAVPVFAGREVEGEDGSTIAVVLQNADFGDVVTTGPESSAKLDIVVLEGDFTADDEGNWSLDEFQKNMVRERDLKGPLLTGEVSVDLKDGVGTLGKLEFTDDSSWTRSRKFRLGVRIALDNCRGGRIREAKTEAFTVENGRGELYKEHYPPALHDEVGRLDCIGREGAFQKRLNNANIFTKEEFLRLGVTDPQKLRKILGMSIKQWKDMKHAKTCGE